MRAAMTCRRSSPTPIPETVPAVPAPPTGRRTLSARLVAGLFLYASVDAGLAVVLAGCKDQAKESAALATRDVAELTELVGKDVDEVTRGLPEGATKLAPLVANGADPRQDIAGVRKALVRTRTSVADLNIAKSTFFALADANGIAIRNDLEEDVMAGQNLGALFPALTTLESGNAGVVTTTGAFPNTSTKNGPDEDWIAGVAVKRENGAAGALLVTGWSYRYFARHLQEALKTRLLEQAKAAGREGQIPVYYVAVFDRKGVYSAPTTPAVDDKALADMDLVAKTANAAYQSTTTIADRAFGVAAARTPILAPDTGVAVLRSDF
jgi:hypothetical protein